MQYPSNITRLTERDEAILIALTHRVKVLSNGQVQTTWWPASESGAHDRRLIQLASAGWLLPIRLLTKTFELYPREPLFTSASTTTTPDFSGVLAIARSRWREPIRSVPAVVAAAKAARYFAGHARYSRLSEGTHDLYLSATYLRRICMNPGAEEEWIGEGGLVGQRRQSDEVVPDALVCCADGKVAVEVVGESYTLTKLRAFHEFCQSRGWRYELW